VLVSGAQACKTGGPVRDRPLLFRR